MRELSKPIELLALCQTLFSRPVYHARGRSTILLAFIPRYDPPRGRTLKPSESALIAQRKSFKQRPAPLEPLEARGGIYPPGHAMACSLRDSLQGSRGSKPTSPDPSNQLPQIPNPGGPIGHQEAPSLQCNFQRIAQAISVCNSRLFFFLRSARRVAAF